MKLIRLKLIVGHVVTTAVGKRVWHLRALPYAANAATANTAAGVQAEARDAAPEQLTLTSRRIDGTKRFRLSGRLMRPE